MRVRVVVYVVRNGRELLVLDGPSGTGVPGGAVEAGEALEDAAVREVEEETGLTATIVRQLGVTGEPGSFEPDFRHESHYFEAVAGAETADEWEHVVTGVGRERGTRVTCRFVPLSAELALVGGRGAFLCELRA
jgi:ADP-ribose pyrophosphatase YjhB (NUDIX family)